MSLQIKGILTPLEEWVTLNIETSERDINSFYIHIPVPDSPSLILNLNNTEAKELAHWILAKLSK